MIIETERLILRNYKETDIEDYFEYVSQPNVGPRSGWSAYTSIEKAKQQLNREIERPLQFAIELKENHKVIGSIALKPTRDTLIENLPYSPEETKELGYLLNENFWGRGIMTEAMKALIKFGFENLNLKAITAGYYEPNIASGRVQAKCGLNPFMRSQNATTWYETGKPADAIECKISREEYDKIEEYKTLKIKIID